MTNLENLMNDTEQLAKILSTSEQFLTTMIDGKWCQKHCSYYEECYFRKTIIDCVSEKKTYEQVLDWLQEEHEKDWVPVE